MKMRLQTRALSAAVGLGVAGGAFANIIPYGCYDLNNHPDGSWANPGYGLILTELYNVHHDKKDYFTFDFEHEKSTVQLCWDGDKIIISGNVYGGRDVGSNYANDKYKGVYEVYFEYHSVSKAGGDDDLWKKNEGDEGWIKTPLGHKIPLDSKSDGNYAFRLGDENDDNGHRGFDGISGWGWLNHNNQSTHHAPSDWLFTLKIPSPGTAALLMAAIPLVAVRRRQQG